MLSSVIVICEVGLMYKEFISALPSGRAVGLQGCWGSCGLTPHFVGEELQVQSGDMRIITVKLTYIECYLSARHLTE